MLPSLAKYLPKKPVYYFVFIFLVHVFFKSLYLDYCGFWFDEVHCVFFSEQHWGHIKHVAEWDINPPLYIYFTYIWRNLFGISEYSIRFACVLFSSLAAGMVFIFSARFFNKATAFIATLIFSASSNILFYAHEARSYSLILFLVLCSSWFFLNLLEKKNTISIIFLGLINFLLIYTHYLIGFIFLFQWVIVLLVFKKDFFKRIFYAYLITLGLCIWRFTVKTILVIFNHEKDFWLPNAGLYEFKTAFYTYFNERNILVFYILLAVVILTHLIYTKRFYRNSKIENLKFVYIVLCGIITVLLGFLISQFTPIFLMRYFLFTSPFMYITIAYLISITEVKLKYIASALVLLVCIYSFSKLELRTQKSMNYRDAMPVIKKLQSPNTVILVETRDMGPLFAYYYDKNIFSDHYNTYARLHEKNIYFVSSAEDVKALDLKKYDKIILTQSFDNINPENASLLAYITSLYKQKASVKYYNEVNILAFSR